MHASQNHSLTVHNFDAAYQWLCRSRKKHPPSFDIWDFRRGWHRQADEVISDFTQGSYLFNVQKKISLACGETIALWSSRDALVIKVLTGIIQDHLKPFLSKACYHLKGNGGLKGAVRDVTKLLPKYAFFCKTDVKFYYDSIDHFTLMMKLYDYIPDRKIINYVWQFLNRLWNGVDCIRILKEAYREGHRFRLFWGRFINLILTGRGQNWM